MTETWGLIYCHEGEITLEFCREWWWEGDGGAVQTNIAPFIPALPDRGQHKAQHYLNPSAAVLLGQWSLVDWKSVHFLPSLHIFS